MTGASWSDAEDDDTLTEEEKAVLRFQQQRMKDAASDRLVPLPQTLKCFLSYCSTAVHAAPALDTGQHPQRLSLTRQGWKP